MRNSLASVETGQRVGLLTVGDLVLNVQNHPLFIETQASYLKHGRLRECRCDCSNLVLYSENILRAGHVKSCGCLRLKRQMNAARKRESTVNKKIHMREINTKIANLQSRLKCLKAAPAHMRNSQESNLEMADI